MKYIKSITLLFISFFIFSCEKEEQPIERQKKTGEQITASVFLDSDYKYQIFYDLESNKEVAKNITTEWDIGFECGDEGYHIKLNASKGMQVWCSGETSFSAVESYSGAEWTWDNPNGSIDSTAIGEWGQKNGEDIISNNQVFVLDMGYNSEGYSQGYKKMKILGLSDNRYQVKIADLSGENEFTKFISKDNDYNFVFLSFENQGAIVSIEPPKDDWDLVFTKYTHTFQSEGVPIPYGVTGILLNPSRISVHRDTIFGFENINRDAAQTLEYSFNHNVIGYDWKTYDYESGSYIIHPEKNFVIKDKSGFYYKFHVIDFYNDSGQKGNIKFEFMLL
ncbi:MAG: hypothetical protein CMP67_09045 [Flavobacteriales bacterium]|nr:hypothetical protein [Flavobacteriales bacterium]MBL57101.1 hypothetical protein [Flavobacteriales bacterium]